MGQLNSGNLRLPRLLTNGSSIFILSKQTSFSRRGLFISFEYSELLPIVNHQCLFVNSSNGRGNRRKRAPVATNDIVRF